MRKGENIICIANTTWFGEYTKSTVQIMSRLAKNNLVLFIEYPFTWKDVFTTILGKQKAPVFRMLGVKKRLEKIYNTDDGTTLYKLIMPPVLPVDFIKNNTLFNFFFKLNIYVYKRTLKQFQKKLNLNNPIVVTAYNAFYGLPLIGGLNEKSNIYYCYDGLGTRRHGRRIFKIDEEFSKKADKIITTSDFLNAEKKAFNPNSFVVKNGVDFNTFNAFAKNTTNKNAKKIVGYIGSLDRRFDIDTMEHAITQLKNYEFHITGNLRNQLIKQRLSDYQNVKFFDPVKPNQVPELLTTYDVGVIPYLINDINKNIYPLKINEYLAVGVPVVMNAFADIPEFNSMVGFAQNKYEFVEKLISEIENDNKSKIKERIEFARQNSWESKSIEFEKIITS